MTLPEEIMAFYSAGKETGRLTKGLGLIEFARLGEIMLRYFPAAPAAAADIGGGPGVYSCWLAAQGYAVHLVDPVPLHVEQAREASACQPDHPLASAGIGDARQLPFADASMDAVLMHGPLYHLTEKADRLLALAEARRVLRPGGVLLAVAVTTFASTIVGLVKGWIWERAYFDMLRQEIKTGQHRCPPDWQLFTTAFFHHPGQLRAEIEEAGFLHQITLGIQGPGWLAPDLDMAWRDEDKRETLLCLARLMEQEPVHSPHMVAVARR